MRGVSNEEDVEEARQSRDTELTLGSGTLLTIFIGFVLVCVLCFGMGYAVGHQGSSSSSVTPPQPATDQEPLQASGAIPKPSAIAQTPVAPPAQAAGSTDQAGTAASAAPNPSEAVAAPVQTSGATAQSEVRPALPIAGPQQTSPSGMAVSIHPALSQPQPSGQEFAVQIAAVFNPEDADVLVNALKKRNYPVISKREPADNMIHVRIGPFASHAIADQWRMKLLNDGYNAIIQP